MLPTRKLLVCLATLVALGPTPSVSQVTSFDTDLVFSILGTHEKELSARIPGLKELPRHLTGPCVGRGHWIVGATSIAGLQFSNTFFVKNGIVSKIEQRLVPSGPDCYEGRFDDLVFGELARRHGPSQAQSALGGAEVKRSGYWVTGEVDITAHSSASQSQC